jgi:hypothetical protein
MECSPPHFNRKKGNFGSNLFPFVATPSGYAISSMLPLELDAASWNVPKWSG